MQDMKNFILVGTQRTGSSALAELIGFHPEIACGWEWTQHIPRKRKIAAAGSALAGDFSELLANDQAYMRQVFNQHKAWLGFRRLFRSSDKWLFHPKLAPALLVDRLEDHLKWLRTRPDIHIIHLRRDDHIAWLKSKFISKESGAYVGKSYPDDIEINIPLGEAVARIKSKMWVDERLTTLQDSNPYHSVWYEDFSADKIAVAHSVYQFLNCNIEAAKLSIETGRKRQSKGPLSNGILNYSDLVSKLQSKNLLRAGRAISVGV
jgi:LPS sulfotransferase NodH